jgi:hypothetical protein
MSRPLRVTFVLPALTEATGPFWRPIKYSLFPPLGLATLAAYLEWNVLRDAAPALQPFGPTCSAWGLRSTI